MTRILALCLSLDLLACATPPAHDVATQPIEQPGATRYHVAHGALIACTKTGFDTICR
jgi:hypothetical protein